MRLNHPTLKSPVLDRQRRHRIELEVIGSRVQSHSRKLPATDSNCLEGEVGGAPRPPHLKRVNFGPDNGGIEWNWRL
jgi:hypothetical protein